jgi:hypothetical protein
MADHQISSGESRLADGSPIQQTWPAHTVVVDFDGGWPTARMYCPFDKADPTRPCWP